MSTAEIPFEEMCYHAKGSLLVNGLRPKEWRWGRDAVTAFRIHQLMWKPYLVQCDPPPNFPKGALLIWQDLPVFPMQASGVACVAH